MKDYIKRATAILAALIVTVDFLGFLSWIESGQIPPDGFYIGRLTVEVLRVFVG